MTSAKLVTSPAEGHGLTQKITDQHFAMAVKGEPVPLLPAVVMLKQVAFDQKETAQGIHRSVRYEVVKLEPITDSNDASELQFMVEALYKERTAPDGQQAFPISFPGQQSEEKRKALMEAIEARWEALDKPGAQGEQDWRDHFGVSDPDGNLYGIPGDYRLASVAHLSQYAFAINAIGGDPEQSEIPAAEFSHAGGIHLVDDELDEADDDPAAPDEEEAGGE